MNLFTILIGFKFLTFNFIYIMYIYNINVQFILVHFKLIIYSSCAITYQKLSANLIMKFTNIITEIQFLMYIIIKIYIEYKNFAKYLKKFKKMLLIFIYKKYYFLLD